LRQTDGQGWIPVNFNQIAAGSPFSQLPIDPINTSSSRNYYTYTPGGSWELTASLEADKNKMGGPQDKTSSDGGNSPGLYETGNSLALNPVDYSDSSLVGYWTFDEGSGTMAYDYSGNGNDGTWYGSLSSSNETHYNAGRVGSWAGYFDGTGNFINAGSAAVLDNLTAYTMTAWVNLANVGNYLRIFSKNGIVRFETRNSGIPDKAYLFGSHRFSGNEANSSASDRINTGTWYYVALTFDATEKKNHLFTNGVEVASGATTGIGTLSSDAAYNLTLGAETGGTYLWSGLIDDARIYNRVLSPKEIQAIYNATK
jgi:hypothetical protein